MTKGKQVNSLKLIRALISFVINESPKTTGELITKEMTTLGMEKFNEQVQPLVEAFGNSDFFKNLAK